jgi:uncharacterized repeat protein (TIGR04138 family)
MTSNQIHERIRREIIESGHDTRYKLEAYLFVLSGLEFFLTQVGEKRHVTGQELSRGLLMFAHKQFGPLASKVFKTWGITRTNDLGNIVYNLIGIQVMSKQPEDRLEDFFDVCDIDEFFAGQQDFEVDKNYIKSVKGA